MSFFKTDSTAQEMAGQWFATSEEFKRLKELEMNQRKELDCILFPTPKNGTNKHELGEGWELHATHGESTTLDVAAWMLIKAELPLDVVDTVVIDKPSLVLKEYNKLEGEVKDMVDDAITTKPKTVTIKLVPPKKEK